MKICRAETGDRIASLNKAKPLALVAAQMATLDAVMLSFLHVNGERTLYEAYQDREAALALAAGDIEDSR